MDAWWTLDAWWVLHGIQDLALLACIVVAMLAVHRVGAHTPYGTFLFVLALSFWFLLIGEWLFLARIATDTWTRPGTEADVVSLAGWLLLDLSFLLVVARFPSKGVPGSVRVLGMVLGKAMLPAALLLAIGFLLSPPGADPDAPLRAAYLAADGLGLGIVLAGARPLRRMQRTALARLYTTLAAAMVLKIMGDLAWVYLAARGGSSIVATAFYPLAGLVTLYAILAHEARLRREPLGAVAAEPWMSPGQLVLRDLAIQVHGVAGGLAAEGTLDAAAQALRQAGAFPRRNGFLLEATAEPLAWHEALVAARDHAVRFLGPAAAAPLARVAAAYGPAYSFLAGAGG